jgi:hypothetical protein
VRHSNLAIIGDAQKSLATSQLFTSHAHFSSRVYPNNIRMLPLGYVLNTRMVLRRIAGRWIEA